MYQRPQARQWHKKFHQIPDVEPVRFVEVVSKDEFDFFENYVKNSSSKLEKLFGTSQPLLFKKVWILSFRIGNTATLILPNVDIS